jgi:membrane protein DedA with SNARE-associated domain
VFGNLYDFVFSIGDTLGYPGILLITFLISLLIFVPIPYIPVLILALFSSRLDPILIALSSAIGVTLGRSVIFYTSYRGRALIDISTLKRMTPLQRLLAKYGSLVSFVAAVTPIPPDDIVIILLGISKSSLLKFILTTFSGKLLINLAVVWAAVLWGLPIVQQFLSQITDPVHLLIIAMTSLIIAVVTVYLVVKLDWGTIIGKWFPWTLNDNNNYDKGLCFFHKALRRSLITHIQGVVAVVLVILNTIISVGLKGIRWGCLLCLQRIGM